MNSIIAKQYGKSSFDSLLSLATLMVELADESQLIKYQALAYFRKGTMFYMKGDFRAATDYFEQSLGFYEETGSKKGIAMVHNLMSWMYLKQNKFRLTLDHLNRSLQIYSELEDSTAIGAGYLQMGSLYYQKADFEKARDFYTKSLEIFQELKNQTYIIALRNNIAYTHASQGEYQVALNTLLENVKYYETKGDLFNLPICYAHIGSIWQELGYYQQALNYYTRSLSMYEERNQNDDIAGLCLTIGSTYLDMGNYALALDQFQQAHDIFQALQHESGLASCYLYFGRLYAEMGEYASGLDYYEKSRVYYKENELSGNVAEVYGLIGESLVAMGRNDSALASYNQSLQLNLDAGLKNAISDDYRKIGLFYRELGDHQMAINYLEQSRVLREEIGVRKGMAEIYLDLGELYLVKGDTAKAIFWIQNGFQLAREIGVLRLIQDGAIRLYRINRARGNSEQALHYYEVSRIADDSLHEEKAYRRLQQMYFDHKRKEDSLLLAEEKIRSELAFIHQLDREQARVRWLVFGGIIILIISAGIYGRMLFIRKTNKKLEEKNTIILREKERAEASEQAKEQFFNNVSHEFRTPLTLISGPVRSVLEKTADEDVKQDLEIISRNADRLEGMINELLDLSKLDFGQVKLKAAEQDIVQVTGEYLQSFESLADQKRITFTFKSVLESCTICFDTEKYRRILANLLSNAFKFTNEGGQIVVSIDCWKSENSEAASMKDKGVTIKVSDSGKGIAPDQLGHIFERFYQAPGQAGVNHPGTGIGLALTRELVELHHGKIEVESEPGKGTTFSVSLRAGQNHFSDGEIAFPPPLKIRKGEKEKKDWALESTISGHVSEDEIRKKDEKPLVLLIEDNQDMRAYIRKNLQIHCIVLEAEDGEQGLQIAFDRIPDLVISDVMMPAMDGYEVTEKLKTDLRTSHIPVIILTARASVESRIEGLETGADAYITKPFNNRELQARVKNLLDQRSRLREHFRASLESQEVYLVEDPQLRSMDRRFLEKAISVVKDHLQDPDFNASHFSSAMAVSRMQLHRKIKALTNKSTTEFIRTVRLNHAAHLIRKKADNITQVAYASGFSSLSWFARCFKLQFGVNPSDYQDSF